MAQPLVSVLTPVYNGEASIARCIESVLAQTYDHWEYVIVDNASTDRTGEIVARYAAHDSRIRVHTNDRLIRVVANYNTALRHIAPDSAWCKFVAADDELFPECLERMVALAEAHPSVGLVAAYRLRGNWVDLDGLPYPISVVPGRMICRWTLLGFPSVFGSPTSHMIRSDFVRGRDHFYDESNLHADEAACYDILRSSDLGFVHQVLAYSPVERDSLSVSVASRLNTFELGQLKVLKTYGHVYLSDAEYDEALEDRLAAHQRFLAQALVTSARREIWAHHRKALRELGIPFSRRGVLRGVLQRLAQLVLSPGTQLPKFVQALRGRPVDHSAWWGTPSGGPFERARLRAFVKWSERRGPSIRREIESVMARPPRRAAEPSPGGPQRIT
ncbi:MAG: glycosyltransferase family 2 protein [Candidatus Rokuibacteriota bacterium]